MSALAQGTEPRGVASPRSTAPPPGDRPKEPLLSIWLGDALYVVKSLASTPRYSLPALL